jgi:hypothetical protein
MPLWKITDSGPKLLPETRLKEEKLLERHFEDWIAADPSLLGEPLLIIGRQVLIPDTKDRLDLLALDSQGAAVIIELKRDQLKDPVDVQALRYASYISKWNFEDFESLATNYLNKVGDPEFNFNELFESFCEESGINEVPDLNSDQRIIIVGSAVRDKLGSVALWLRDHRVDITLIEVQVYKEGKELIIEPAVIVPLQVSKFKDVGKIRSEGTPWMTNGMVWHLEKRCSPKTQDMFLSLNEFLQAHFNVDGPHWNQKYYVAYRLQSFNWICVHTQPKALVLDVYVRTRKFTINQVAKELGVAKFEKEESLSEKLGLPSSVSITNIRENLDRIRIRAKSDFDLASEGFKRFLEQAYSAFSK